MTNTTKSKKSKKILLDDYQINKLLEHLVNVIQYIQEIKENETDPSIKDCIKQVQIPVRLSESIALKILREKTIIEDFNILCNFNFGKGKGKKTFDIEYSDGSIKIDIEVKATGTNTFQRFLEHARQSNYIIWVDFWGLRESSVSKMYDVYLIKTRDIFETPTDKGEIDIKKITNKKKIS